MASDKVSFARGDEVGSANWLWTESQMRNGDGAGFLRVILKVALGVVGGLITNDLDRVLVRTDSAIGTETKEDRLDHVVFQDLERGVVINTEVGDIIYDTDGEAVLGLILGKLVEDALDHRWGEILGRKTITTTGNQRHLLAGRSALQNARRQSIDDILEERLTDGTGFLGAVEHSNFLDAGGDHAQEVFNGEWPVKAHNHHTHFFAMTIQVFGNFSGSLRAGAHDHDHAVCVGSAVIFHDLVFAAGQVCKAFHFLFNDANALVIVAVNRLTTLEVHIGVLGRTADYGGIRGQGALAMRNDHIFIHNGAQIFVGKTFDLVDLVGGAEAVKEMDKRYTGAQARSCRNRGGILGFLGRVGGD